MTTVPGTMPRFPSRRGEVCLFFSLVTITIFVTVFSEDLSTNIDNKTAQAVRRKERRNLSDRIVGGTPVENADKFPSFGRTTGGNLCGGTLIHPDIFLTAGHCKGAFTSGVYLGGNRLDGSTSEFIFVDEEIQHPDYIFETDKNDIMLVKLSNPSTAALTVLNFNRRVGQTNDKVKVIGHGLTREKGQQLASKLRDVSVSVMDFNFCSEYWGPKYNLTNELVICAGDINGNKDGCVGDSGGPLFVIDKINKTFKQVGIVSIGQGCGRPNVPAIYTRISGYKTFIRSTICNYTTSFKPKYCENSAR